MILRVEKKQMKFWTLERYKALDSLINEDEYFLKAFFATAYFTGARCGELLTLSWDDILLNHTVDIDKTLHNVAGDSFYDSSKTKSSIRQVPINARLYGILMKWKTEQKQIIESYLLERSEDTPVFQFREIPPTRNHYTKRIATICKRGTLEPIRLHDFRHSHVALLIEMKEEPLLISKRIGHSDYTTTMNIYAHLFPNKQRNLANKLDGLF